ncbi:putative PIF1 DNA helicase/replication protein A1-like protein [Tanacetum coccineum]|uniref:PIF1 DNA helicase/replication protein A1-like protein n=1 Tax=Tanacetum coccineum TaxID=301880 RepID=A0ABQ5HVC3_9ASTR
MLDQSSSVAKAFRMPRYWCHSHGLVNFKLRLLSEISASRQYNMPTVSEVAALITNDFGNGIPSRDIIVNSKDAGPKRISELHPGYMALQYPLLFMYGEDSFHEKIPYRNNTSARKTRCGFQYLINAYTAVEEQRLKWMRNNQDTLRVDLYHNMYDVVTRGGTNATGLGKKIVLPASLTGRPRYMIQNYQDVMALCWAYRNPYLFITFTSNPKWLKIAGMLSFMPG